MNDYRVNGRKMLNDEKFKEGRAEVLAIATNPESMKTVRKHAQAGYDSVRDIPLMHKPGSKKAHPAGLSVRLGIQDRGVSLDLITDKGKPENFLPAPPGGSWKIMCAGCPDEIVRKQAGLMLDALKVLASRGTTREARSVTLR